MARVLRLLQAHGCLVAFARGALQDRRLRRHFVGRGMCLRGRRWTLQTGALARSCDACWRHPGAPRAGAQRLHWLAERTLLTVGKTFCHRRQRALLDAYGAFVRAQAAASRPRPGAPRRPLPQPAPGRP